MLEAISIEPISKMGFVEIFKYWPMMQGGFCRPYQRVSGQKSQRSRMGKDAEKFQKVFLRWVLIIPEGLFKNPNLVEGGF
jgi:hypothetical protein